MSRSQSLRPYRTYNSYPLGMVCYSAQRGYLIPVALVIIIGLSALAVTLSRLSSQSGSASLREAITAQAFYAADSGMQYAMHSLLFPNASHTIATSSCASIDSRVLNLDAPGLRNCQTRLQCSLTTDTNNRRSVYTVQSRARCGSGELLAERAIEAATVLQHP